MNDGNVIVCKNKDLFNYTIIERFEAGIVLAGSEVKSLRDKKVSLRGSYCSFTGSELFIVNMRIDNYRSSDFVKLEPERPRKLLLDKRELIRLRRKVEEKGFTIIPVSVYFKKQFAKIEIALVTGKTQRDRRHEIRERELNRELARLNKNRR